MLYASLVVVALTFIVWFMPKNLQKKDMIMIWISMSYLEIVIDYYLGYALGLYQFLGDPEVSPEAFTIKLVMSPLFAILFLNYMPKVFSSFIPYWGLWTAAAAFFEWTTVYLGYLTYTGWKLWYSAIFYFFIFWFVRRFYFYIK